MAPSPGCAGPVEFTLASASLLKGFNPRPTATLENQTDLDGARAERARFSNLWGFYLRAEGRPAAAGARGARIVEAKPGAMQAFYVIQSGARDIGQGKIVNQNADAAEVYDPVAFLLAGKVELVLEAGAASTHHANTKSLIGSQALLRVHLTHHLDCFRGEIHVGKRGSIDLRRLALVVLAQFYGHQRLLVFKANDYQIWSQSVHYSGERLVPENARLFGVGDRSSTDSRAYCRLGRICAGRFQPDQTSE